MSPFQALTARLRHIFVILGILALAALVAAVMLGVRPPGTTQASPSGKIYWTDSGTHKIQRANLDGTGVEDLVTTGLTSPAGLALDVSGGKMYWTDRTAGKIQRANLDGTVVEDLVTGLGRPIGIAVDVSGGKMYWADNATGKIQRASLDGTSVEDFVLLTCGPPSGCPYGAELDVSEGKLYWTTLLGDIQRANLDGSAVEILVTGLIAPTDIALDIGGTKMYWSEVNPGSPGFASTGRILRANLDGSGVKSLVNMGLGSDLRGIALDVPKGKMYWTDVGFRKIQRADLDGFDVEDLVTTGLSFPVGIALDIPEPPPGATPKPTRTPIPTLTPIPTPTPNPTPTPFDFGGTPVVVGGFVSDLKSDDAGLPLETARSSDSNALLVGVAAGAGAIALAGAAWYARRRWLR